MLATSLEGVVSDTEGVRGGKDMDVPLFSFCVTRMISPSRRLSSPADWPAKSYRALKVGSFGAAGAAAGGGGGGGGARDAEFEREWFAEPLRAATGCGTGLGWGTDIMAGAGGTARD